MAEDKIKSLYDAFVNDGYDMEPLDEFRKNLADGNKRRAAYDALVNDGYEMEPFDEFESNLGFSATAQTETAQAGPVETQQIDNTQQEQSPEPVEQPEQPTKPQTPKPEVSDDWREVRERMYSKQPELTDEEKELIEFASYHQPSKPGTAVTEDRRVVKTHLNDNNEVVHDEGGRPLDINMFGPEYQRGYSMEPNRLGYIVQGWMDGPLVGSLDEKSLRFAHIAGYRDSKAYDEARKKAATMSDDELRNEYNRISQGIDYDEAIRIGFANDIAATMQAYVLEMRHRDLGFGAGANPTTGEFYYAQAMQNPVVANVASGLDGMSDAEIGANMEQVLRSRNMSTNDKALLMAAAAVYARNNNTDIDEAWRRTVGTIQERIAREDIDRIYQEEREKASSRGWAAYEHTSKAGPADEFGSARAWNAYQRAEDTGAMLKEATQRLWRESPNARAYFRTLYAQYRNQGASKEEAERLVSQSIYNTFVGKEVERMMPKSDVDWIVQQVATGTTIAALGRALTNLDGSDSVNNQLFDQAMSAYGEYRASKLAQVLAPTFTIVADVFTGGFVPAEKFATTGVQMVTKGLAWGGAKRFGVSMAVAENRILGSAALKYGGKVLHGALNFGTYDLYSHLLGDAARGQLDAGRAVEGGLTGLLKGAIFGIVGAGAGKFTEGLTGKEALIGEAGTILAEGMTFSAMDYVQNGEITLTDLARNTLMPLGLRASNPRRYVADLYNRYKGDKSKSNGVRISDKTADELAANGYPEIARFLRDESVVTDMYQAFKGEAKKAKDKAKQRLESGTTAMTTYDGREMGRDEASSMMDRMEEELRRMYSDKRVPWSVLRQAEFVLNGRTLAPTMAFSHKLVTFDEDGLMYGYTYDSEGREISRYQLKNDKEALQWQRAMDHECENNAIAWAENVRRQQDGMEVLRQACQQYVAENPGGYGSAEDLYNAMVAAMRSGQTDGANKKAFQEVMDIAEAYVLANDKDGAKEIREKVEKQFGVNIDEVLKKDLDQRDNNETVALDTYIDELTGRARAVEDISDAVVENVEKTPVEDAHDDGYNAPDEDQAGIKQRLDVARQRLQELGLSNEEIENLDWDKRLGLPDQYLDATAEYLEARAAYEGVIEHVQEEMERQVQASDELVDQQTHQDTGMMQRARLKGGEEVFVVGGELKLNEDNTIDVEGSSDEIIVIDATNPDSEPRMISVKDLVDADEPMPADQVKQQNADEIRQAVAQGAADRIDGVLPFNPGDTYTLPFDGLEHAIYIIGDAGDGANVIVTIDGGEQTLMPRQMIQDAADAQRQAQIDAEVQAAAAATAAQPQPTGQEGELVEAPAEEASQSDAILEQPAEEEEPVAEIGEPDGVEPMPMKGGEVDWLATTPERGHRFLYDEAGLSPEEADAVVANSVKDAEKELEKVSKKAPKPGNAAQLNKYRAEKEAHEQQVAAAQAAVDYWKGVQATQEAIRQQAEAELLAQRAEEGKQRSEAAAQNEAEKEAQRLADREAARQEREALNGVPDVVNDKPEDARARGFRNVNGERVDRQLLTNSVGGRTGSVKFSTDVTVPSRIAVIEADELQPSHIEGQRNPLFFLDEAQPKNRTDQASDVAAEKIAKNINPEEITGDGGAYQFSAPTVNERGEVVQGNNRSSALKRMWSSGAYADSQQRYKQYLIDHAEEFGLNPQLVASMNRPVMVNEISVDDAEAIRLGQMSAKDLESGGIERIDPVTTARKLGPKMRNFAGVLLRGEDENMSLSELIAANGEAAVKWLADRGVISPTQVQSAWNPAKTGLTAEAKLDLQNILRQQLFQGGVSDLPHMFEAMPAKAQKAILSTFMRDMDSADADRILPELQHAIEAWYGAASGTSDFSKATNYEAASRAMLGWTNVRNAFSGVLPSEKFSKFAIELANRLQGSSMRNMVTYFNEFYDLVQGTGVGDLFGSGVSGEKLTLAEAIAKIFNVDINETNNGQERREDVGSDRGDGQEGRQGEPGDAAGTEPATPGAGTSERGGRAESNDQSVAQAEVEVDTEPTEGQKEAGNYKKGHVKIDGFDVTIEQPKGSVRSGVDASGKAWSQEMHNTYGYIRGTEGVDGDHIDVFLSDHLDNWNGMVYVVDQVNKDGSFDEHKVMYGFDSEQEARDAYLSNYEEGWTGLGNITGVTRDEFKKWVDSSHRKTKPFAEYKSVKVSRPIQGLDGYTEQEVLDSVRGYIEEQLEDAGIEGVTIKGMALHGSRMRGDARPDSDLDVVVEYEGDISEDSFFNLVNYDLNFRGPNGVIIDINPITRGKSGTLEQYMERSRRYDEEKRAAATEATEPVQSTDTGDQAYTITPTKYTTKKNKELDVWLVKFSGEIDKKQATEIAKETRGWWDREQGGFLMRSEEAARDLAERVAGGASQSDAIPQQPAEGAKRERVVTMDDLKALDGVSFKDRETGDVITIHPFIDKTHVAFTWNGRPAHDFWATLAQMLNSDTWEQISAEDAAAWLKKQEENFDPFEPEENAEPSQSAGTDNQAEGGFAVGERVFYKNVEHEVTGVNADGTLELTTNTTGVLPITHMNISPDEVRKPGSEQSIKFFHDAFVDHIKQKGLSVDDCKAILAEVEKQIDDLAPQIEGGTTTAAKAEEMARLLGMCQALTEKIDGTGRVSNATNETKQEPRQSRGTEDRAGAKQEAPKRQRTKKESKQEGPKQEKAKQEKPKTERKRVVSDDRMAELKERLRKKLGGQLNVGVDPELLAIGAELAVGHIERGLTKFADFAKAMIEDVGDVIRPYLKSFYNAVRDMPEAEAYADELTSYDEVRKFDIAHFDKEGPKDVVVTAKAIVDEQKAEKDVKEITEKAKKTSKNKKNNVSSQQVLSLFDLAPAKEQEDQEAEETKQPSKQEDNGLPRTDELRSEGLPADSGNTGEQAGGLREATGQAGERADREGEAAGGRGVQRGLHDGLRPADQLEGPSPKLNQNNNHVERGKDYAPKDVDARIEANIAAIELMKKLVESGKQATPKDMAVLRKFSGWGGLGKAFNESAYGWSSDGVPSRLRKLLGDEGYDQAEMSRNSGFYTPGKTIDALWDIARALGFKGGNVLEGSAGIGNILGLMPTDLSERSHIHAVEIDNTTGNILKLLYPDAKVEIQGFEETRVQNGSVDLSITNVPFVTGLHVIDTSGDKDLSKKFRDIHDFCIAKNVRKLREGGIGIFITSSGTLDNSQKLRDWLVSEGGSDVVGAFRLNNTTFGGTSVTSDIIVVRKRVNGQKSPNAIDVSTVTGVRVANHETGEFKTVKGKQVPVIKPMPLEYNKYFVEHPEMMGGEMAFGFEKGETYRETSRALYPKRGINQDERLKAFVEDIAGKDWSSETAAQPRPTEQEETVYDELGEGIKEGSMLIDSNGKLCVARYGQAVPLDVNDKKIKGRTKQQCFQDYNAIKEALNAVLDYQTEHDDDAGLQPLLDNLNKVFDDFVNRYGHFQAMSGKPLAISFLRNDMDFSSIAALESKKEYNDDNNVRQATYSKSDIFNKRVVKKDAEPKPANVRDGVITSIYKFGRVDVPYISEQLGKSPDEVKAAIVEEGVGFENPMTREMEVSFEYCSGNVREKLRQAREHNDNGQYDANIKALEAVIPMNIPAHLVEFTLGSSWLNPKLYSDFITERTGIKATVSLVGGTWIVNTPGYVYTEQNRAMGVESKMCNKFVYGHELITAALQNKTVRVTKTKKHYDGHTETIVDKEATQVCSTKIDEIRQDFKDWAREKIQKDPEMSAEIEETYNETFNNYVPREIPDSFVPEYFEGASHARKLRPFQAKAAIRATMQNVMLAHEVGTGKTLTLITTAMEMRRLGTARKPMIVVQNATVGQFVASAKKQYPRAKILTLEDADRNAEGRKAFYAKIKYNDWDMIVIPQSAFEMIPDSEERQMNFVRDKIDEKMLVLQQMKEAGEDENGAVYKQAERELEKLEEELNNLSTASIEKRKQKDGKREAKTRQNAAVQAREMLDRKVDDVEDFDQMGIDAILIDEAHEYKHLGFATAMQRGVKGVDPSYSKKSQGVFLKARAVMERTGGKNVVFATGTPISNTAAEIWTFMRYLMPAETMKDYGIYYFDDFVRNFGNITQMLEFATNGRFKENNRFAGYVNLPELVRIWSSVADTVLSSESSDLMQKIPEMEGGKAQDIYLPQSKALRSVMKYVKAHLDEYDKMSGKEKKENSHIPLTMYGIAKAAAVDVRLVLSPEGDVSGHESSGGAVSDYYDDPHSKTNEAVRQTLKTLEETASYRGTVAIFADNYQNKTSGFNLYEDIRKKLIAAGVPADQIVIIKSGMGVTKKLEIFDKVKAGEIRVIMGSTFTLGTGVNIQERLNTLIHVDAPNRPMDYTQRNGRILRQGNIHKQMDKPVRVLRFGVEDSLDVTAYQRLKTKGAIADSIMHGKQLMSNSMENRTMEEDEDVFGDITAQLSGSEYALLKNQAEREVRKLEGKRKQYEADQVYIHSQKPRLAGLIRASQKARAEAEAALKVLEGVDMSKGITIGKQHFNSIDEMDDFIKEYNKKITEDRERVRKSFMGDTAVSEITMNIGGIDFKVKTVLRAEEERRGTTITHVIRRDMVYTCDALGLTAGVPVKQGLLRNAIEDITENVLTGKDARERIEVAESSIARNEKELATISEREGKPFEQAEELKAAKDRLVEYEKLMKAELEAKEAKYAEMDADIEEAEDVSLDEDDEMLYREDDEEDEKNLPEDEDNSKIISNFVPSRDMNNLPAPIYILEGADAEAWVNRHKEVLLKRCRELADPENVLDPDEVRNILQLIGYNGKNVPAYKKAGNILVDELFKRQMREAIDNGNSSITFMSGIGGAGKGTSLKRGGISTSDRGVVYDAAFNDWKKLLRKMKEAADAGMTDIEVIVVHNDALTAFKNTVSRGKKIGRFLGVNYFLDSYEERADLLKHITDRANEIDALVTIRPLDNAGNDGRGEISIEQAIAEWDYNPITYLENILNFLDDEIQQEGLRGDQITSVAGDLPDLIRRLGEEDGTEGRMAGRPIRSLLGNALSAVLERLEGEEPLFRDDESGEEVLYREREGEPPTKTGIGYKVFVLKDGNLYPPMVANPGGAATPVGIWLDADAAPVAGVSKTGRQKVKAGGKGTQGGSGMLAYRPGWHLGEIPYALQFNRLNPETGQRELFPANFVWAEVEYAADVDYQDEAMSYGMNASGKFQHSLAGLPRVPENGAYKYRTNPNPETDPWIITGAMKVNRILTPSEVDAMVKAAGREPQQREAGAVTDNQIEALNNQIRANSAQYNNGSEAKLRETLTDGGSLAISQGENGKWRIEGMPGEYNSRYAALDEWRERASGNFIWYESEDGSHIEIEGEGDMYETVSRTNTTSGRQRAERMRRQQEARNKRGRRLIDELAEKLGFKPRYLEDMSEEELSKLSDRQKKSKGWYDPKTGEIYINLSRHTRLYDILSTFLHETVAHKGLRRLFGKDFDTFIDNVYNNVNDDIRAEIGRMAERLKAKASDRQRARHDDMHWKRVATEEYMAKLAERLDMRHPEQRTVWQKIKGWLINALRRAGVKFADALSDNDLRGILWESYHNMEMEGVVGVAEGRAFRDRMEREAVNGRKATAHETLPIAAERGARYTGSLFDYLPEAGAWARMMSNLSERELRAEIEKDGPDVVSNYSEEYDKRHIDEYNRVWDAVQARLDHDRPSMGKAIEQLEELNSVWYSGAFKNDHRAATMAARDALKEYIGFEEDVEDGYVEPMPDIYSDRPGEPGLLGEADMDLRFNDDDEPEGQEDVSGVDVNGFDAGRMTFEESITAGMMKAANTNRASLDARVNAMRQLGGDLSKLRQAMSYQREYDRGTVDSIIRLARSVMDSGFFRAFSPYEVKRLMSMINNAAGREDITKQAGKVVDLLIKHQLLGSEIMLYEQLRKKGSKVNASGVEVQAGLDIKGQRMVAAMKSAMELNEDALNERIEDCLDRLGSNDQALSDNAASEYEGLMLAKMYQEDIKESKNEENIIRQELQKAKTEYQAGLMTRDEYRQYVAETENALRENRLDRVNAYDNLTTALGAGIAQSVERARAWREEQKERVRDIQHNANSDLEGLSPAEHGQVPWTHDVTNSIVFRFFLNPMSTFSYMMRLFGRKHPNGEGYLFNRFMRGWVDADEVEWKNIKAAHQALDEKVKEVFGRDAIAPDGTPLPKFKLERWSDLYTLDRKLPGMEVEFWDAGERKTYQLSQGNLLYIYMVNKMSDGRMKLRKMGITEEDVETIRQHIDPRFIQLADWLQNDFLTNKRNDYNAVHERLFGASMAAIENYFPLKVNARSRGQDIDISKKDDEDPKPSTVTGSIIKRTRNSLPLDVTRANAFDVILEHIQQMEHWAAFAEWNRDINTLLSYKRFRNRVLNMATMRYGAGKELWINLKKTCAIAGGVYRPKADGVDKWAVNLSKGVTVGAINFRLYTAMKQLASYPAYFSEANPLFLLKNTEISGAVRSWNWAIENLPGFARRWQSRQAGDSRLRETDLDWRWWRNRFVEKATRLGMKPNALVDGITVAIGARSIYETKLRQYRKTGYSEDEAQRRALQDASISYNETQQSSANAYLSPMQLDRTLASTAWTVFRNAPMGYQRRLLQAITNLKHMLTPGSHYRTNAIESMTKQMMRDGIEEEQAKRAANRIYLKALAKNAGDVAIFGWVMQYAWYLMSYLPYLIFGSDDDKKKEMERDARLHARFGPLEGLTMGNVMSDQFHSMLMGDKLYNTDILPLPFLTNTERLKDRFSRDTMEGLTALVDLAVQIGVGVNPQVLSDFVAASVDAAHCDLGLARESMYWALRVMQIPQSQLDEIYLDELQLHGKDIPKMSPTELTKRYVEYKMQREAPTRLVYKDSGTDAIVERYTKRFVTKIGERVAALPDEALINILNLEDTTISGKAQTEYGKRVGMMNGDQIKAEFERGDSVMRKVVGSEYAKRIGAEKDTYGQKSHDNWSDESKAYWDAYQRLRTTEDINLDVAIQNAIKRLKNTDEARAKEIDKARTKINNQIKKQLGQGKDDKQIMKEYRQARRELMQEYGIEE